MFEYIALKCTVFFAALASVGAILYLAWNLTVPTMLLSVLFAAVITARLPLARNLPQGHPKPRPSSAWLLLPLFLSLGAGVITLARSGTEASITTPWAVISPFFWITVVVAAVSAAVVFYKNRTSALFASIALFALGSSVALIVYKIGYGFDPFIHEAAEKYILAHGSIPPKTIYYAGQYAIVTTISKLTGAPVHWVDALLLPALATISIPASIVIVGKKLNRATAPLLAAVLMVLPFTNWINTTPFGLALLFSLLAAIFVLPKNTPDLQKIAALFAFTSFLIHPIAGIGTCVLVTITIFHKQNLLHRSLRIASLTLATLLLPALFLILGKVADNGTTFNFEGFRAAWQALKDAPLPYQELLTRFHPLMDVVYASGAVVAVAVVVFAILSLKEKMLDTKNHLVVAGATVLSGILMATTISYGGLPAYEQGGYGARTFVLAFLFVIPGAIVTFAKYLEDGVKTRTNFLIATALFAFLFTSNLYLSYPRSDAYVLGHGYATSKTDIQTVHEIAKDAGSDPYIVLAPQPVSAAALSQFGFFKYFDTTEGTLFAYPVPTGGPLYNLFTEMVNDDPKKEYVDAALGLTGAKRAYFVLPHYWSRAEHLEYEAKKTASSSWSVGGQNTVFLYKP